MHLGQSWTPNPYEGKPVLMNYQRRLFLFFIQAQFQIAKLLDHLPEFKYRFCLLLPTTRVAYQGFWLSVGRGGEGVCISLLCIIWTLGLISLTSCGYAHPSPCITKSGSLPTGSYSISSGFLHWFSILSSFYVSGNFPRFLINPVIALKKIFIIIYSVFSRCFILGGSSSNLIFHNTRNESYVRHFTWIILLILYNNPIIYVLLVQEI